MTDETLNLELLDIRLAVARLAPKDSVPEWAQGLPVSVTRTDQELSIVCPEENIPPSVPAERGWTCLVVAGPLDSGAVGIIASLTGSLADAGIPVFVISTYDTDYLLIKAVDLETALAALSTAGHRIL